MQARARAMRGEGRRIGLVPTMGYLHEGHLSLVRLARARADVVIVSLFVNPIQFGPREDFNRYPRDFARDEKLCREAGVDLLFHPEPADMYAPDHSVYVEETKLGSGLCGAARPGHFRGVTTVVLKLFHITGADVAVFGEKDAQQVRVIRRMVRDLNVPVEIVSGPTCREPDGLAMSSRNTLLAASERREAVCLRRALDRAEQLYAAGERRADALVAAMREVVAAAPSAVVDYIEVVDDESLAPVRELTAPALVALAVKFPSTRLIDNTVLGRAAD